MKNIDDTIRDLLVYDESSPSRLRWKSRPSSTSCVVAGDIAGCFSEKTGYWTVGIDYKIYKVHRIVWFLFSGEWPTVVDHKNRIKSDNTISNLRGSDYNVNNHNRSGRVGYSYNKNRGYFEVGCQRSGVRRRAICHTVDEAAAKYEEFKNELYGDIYD